MKKEYFKRIFLIFFQVCFLGCYFFIIEKQIENYDFSFTWTLIVGTIGVTFFG